MNERRGFKQSVVFSVRETLGEELMAYVERTVRNPRQWRNFKCALDRICFMQSSSGMGFEMIPLSIEAKRVMISIIALKNAGNYHQVIYHPGNSVATNTTASRMSLSSYGKSMRLPVASHGKFTNNFLNICITESAHSYKWYEFAGRNKMIAAGLIGRLP